jgi:hypothetical protein
MTSIGFSFRSVPNRPTPAEAGIGGGCSDATLQHAYGVGTSLTAYNRH